jgi:hypothetical protein
VNISQNSRRLPSGKVSLFSCLQEEFSILLSAKIASQQGNVSQVRNTSQVGHISQLGNASHLGNTSQMGNALQMGNPCKKYVGFHAFFLGRVFPFKCDRSGKVHGFFVKYSPLVATLQSLTQRIFKCKCLQHHLWVGGFLQNIL